MTLSTQAKPEIKPTAALYVRVSTEDQAKHGFSLRAQEEALKNYAKALGYKIYKVYKDEGKSAKDLKNRPEMQKLLQDAESRKFAAIFIYKLDRFSRSVIDLILTIDKLKQWGVDFVSLQDKIETASATGKLNFHIISAFAEFERNVIGERTKFGMNRKASEGSFVSKAPLGYKYKNKQLVVDQLAAKKVLSIFKDFISTNITFTQLAKNYNMSTRGIIKLLSNKTYTGLVKFGKEYEGKHQPIINDELFEAAHIKYSKKLLKKD